MGLLHAMQKVIYKGSKGDVFDNLPKIMKNIDASLVLLGTDINNRNR